MAEFWESNFKDKQTMWGFEPADSAIDCSKFFEKHGLKRILIPGFGYGRNASVFTDRGFDITGIEISETAIDLAKKYYGEHIQVHHGSVADMPFDKLMYDGVFCYALIHLLPAIERATLIQNCYNQLRPGGYMVFVAISKNTAANPPRLISGFALRFLLPAPSNPPYTTGRSGIQNLRRW